jgi:hypothetical protein
MAGMIVELLPSMFGLAITPTAIALCILFLSSKRPLANATAFAAPFAILYSLFAIVMLSAAAGSDEPLLDKTAKELIGLGIGLFLLAFAAFQDVRGHRPQRQIRKAGMLDRVEEARPLMALGIGFVVAFLNPNLPILIAGLATAAAAEVSQADRTIGAVLLVVAAETGMIVPILWYAAMPLKASPGLAKVRAWLSEHERTLNIAVLLVFGTIFTLKGLVGLLT